MATKTTYRVQGIPGDASFVDAKTIISKAFVKKGIKADPTVHSLASEPNSLPNEGTKVATITFAQTPEILKKQKEITLSVSWGNERHHIYVDSSFQGFTPLNDTACSPCDTIDVIAVSGLSSHPFGSWKARGGSFMWLRDEVARTANRVRVLLYGYDTTLVNSQSFQDIGDISTRLSSDINAMRSKRRSYAPIVPIPIIFIAHSLGGLVVKEAIYKMSEKHHDDFLSVYALLFFGVPNDGIETKYWMPIVDRMPNRNLIASLEPDASFLRTLQENFNRVFCFHDARILSVYETMRSPTAKEESTGEWKLTGPPDILVTRTSAIGRYSDKVQHTNTAFNQNHSDLPKFMSGFDQNYKNIEPFFTESCKDAFEEIQKRFIDEAMRPKYSVNSTQVRRFECISCGMKFELQVKLLQHIRRQDHDACHRRLVLHCIESDRLSMLRMLLAHDRRTWLTNRTGGTLLHCTAKIGHVKATQLLLDLGADIHATSEDRYEATPLHVAVRYGNLGVVKLLLRWRAHVEAVTSHGSTSLHLAAVDGRADIAKSLLDHGAQIEARDGHSETPLHLAAWEGHVHIAKLLLDQGAAINALQQYRRTPLSHAAVNGHIEMARLLLDHGADIEAQGIDGTTSVDAASMNGQKRMVELLLGRGASVMHEASYMGVIIPNRPRPWPRHASRRGNAAAFKSWFDQRAGWIVLELSKMRLAST